MNTLAAMINELNRNDEIHIVTLEDPIEFFHPHHKAAISQRELGKDFHSFSDGLRAALRQAPKVILVGEIRDRETLEIAMTAWPRPTEPHILTADDDKTRETFSA